MAVGFHSVDDDLYREIILDHYRNPRRKRAVEPADVAVEAANPLCGDEVTLTLRVKDGRVEDVGFTGRGCSISQASASMMCEEVAGRSSEDAAALGRRFKGMLMQGLQPDDLGDLEALQGVRQYPVRIKCAVLPWNALLRGLEGTAADDDQETHVHE
ncbi:MAG TPA: SUF system NifU family Fe-S cluster assembly protein [Candidatus Angelobacter sp.]|nr:SUF system NifU family Fe-S cluster assembly protein [Candidatus Angelobacter sp.]